MKLKRESLQPSIASKLRLNEDDNNQRVVRQPQRRLNEENLSLDDDLSFESSYINDYSSIENNYNNAMNNYNNVVPNRDVYAPRPNNYTESVDKGNVFIDDDGNSYVVNDSNYVDINDNELYGDSYSALSSAYGVDVNGLINEAMKNGSASTNIKLK